MFERNEKDMTCPYTSLLNNYQRPPQVKPQQQLCMNSEVLDISLIPLVFVFYHYRKKKTNVNLGKSKKENVIDKRNSF